MAVRIRMKKMGRKHRPFYRICVMDARSPRGGKAIEEVGTYDPMVRVKSDRVALKLERIDYWLSVGALPTEKVAVLIKKVRNNKFGEAKQPPPMQAPKAPEPEPEPAAEADATDGAEAETKTEEAAGETAEAAADDAAAADDTAAAEGGES